MGTTFQGYEEVEEYLITKNAIPEIPVSDNSRVACIALSVLP